MYPLHRWRLFNELHSYDIGDARWTKINPATEVRPPTMAGHSATIHNNQMIVYGGLQKQRTIGQFSSSSDVWAFDLESEHMFIVETVPYACCPVAPKIGLTIVPASVL